MAARNELAACADVLGWLKAEATARGGGGLQNGIPIVYHPLAPVFLPGNFCQYIVGKVGSDLPALNAPESTEITTTLAGALRALTRTGAATATDERVSREPKTVQEVYKETYGTLLRFCNVTETTEVLAPVWHHLANCTKSEQHTIVTQEFQRVCMARGLSTELYAPS